MKFLWIFLTLQGISGSYIVLPQEKETWLNASRICQNHYRGKLLSSVQGSRQKMECLSNYTSAVQLWSRKGLILSPFLSHEGCFEILSSMTTQIKEMKHIQSVGECYINCRNRAEYFGIQIDTCYCITNQEKLMLNRSSPTPCNQTCRGSTYDELEFCGGRSALNLYKEMEIHITSNKGGGKCAVINCTYLDYHLSAQKCGSKFRFVCAGQNYQNGLTVNFTTATSSCKTQNMEYLSPNLSPLCDTPQSRAGEKYWLDVRRYWAPSVNIQDHTRENEFKCGYFLYGISVDMRFEDNCINSNAERRYACETDTKPVHGDVITCSLLSKEESTVDTAKPSESTQLYSSTLTSSTTSQTRESISITYTQVTSISTEVYVNQISMDTSQSGNSSAIIGAVVGMLVTTGLVAALTVFLVLRRRKVTQRERSKSSEMIESQESKDNFKLKEKQNASQSHDIDKESRHYFRLEANPKHNIDVGAPPQEHLQSEDEYNEADDTVYHETSNDVYDHLNERRKKTTENEDMYHVANGFQSDNDEYQHIHSLKGVTNRESSSDYARFNEDQYSAIQREK